MQDARTSRRDTAKSRRGHAGVIASYVHELSERHDAQRRERPSDESRRQTRSLQSAQLRPCEGA
jgi:hypothetical protein